MLGAVRRGQQEALDMTPRWEGCPGKPRRPASFSSLVLVQETGPGPRPLTDCHGLRRSVLAYLFGCI